MTKLYNKTSEKQKRQALRNNIPPAEKMVWAKLRSQQVEDCKFRRQYSIGAFVVDFYSPELKLAIKLTETLITKMAHQSMTVKGRRFWKTKERKS